MHSVIFFSKSTTQHSNPPTNLAELMLKKITTKLLKNYIPLCHQALNHQQCFEAAQKFNACMDLLNAEQTAIIRTIFQRAVRLIHDNPILDFNDDRCPDASIKNQVLDLVISVQNSINQACQTYFPHCIPYLMNRTDDIFDLITACKSNQAHSEPDESGFCSLQRTTSYQDFSNLV